MTWRRSKADNILLGTTEEEFLRAARQYVESAFPNPDRVGCPGRDRLEALARHEWQQNDFLHDVEHVVNCSTCFVEYHAIRKARKRKRVAVAGALGGAVLAFMAFSTIAIIHGHRADVPTPAIGTPVQVTEEEVRRIVIDLRAIEANRGESSTERRSPIGRITLQRAKWRLNIQLPVGSEEGRYLVQILDLADAPRLNASGNAAITNYITTLEVPLDLRSLSPGPFKLTVGRTGMRALSCPVEVR